MKKQYGQCKRRIVTAAAALVVAAAFPPVTASAEIHAPSGSQNVSTKNTDNFLEGERRKFLEAMERLDDIGLSPSAIVHTLTARGQKPDAAAEAETSSSKETGGQDNAARGEIPDAAGGQEILQELGLLQNKK